MMKKSTVTTKQKVAGGVAHSLPKDLRESLTHSPKVLNLWNDLTPLGRNEFICWVLDAKKPETRKKRINRVGEELVEGKRRPCCWAGCPHRGAH